jgi:2-polyprenyl-6-hydroxyphenyl methylase/3-demethylubiquinone-9 3-methyltransferase
MHDTDRFAFGRNWQAFLSVVNEESVRSAETSLRTLLGVEHLAGKRFVDIGSGSGLSSLAARHLGATVHSFDYDPQSVACTATLRQRYFPDDPLWTVEQGSALDTVYLSTLGQADVVYSWGVLHHTGAMWQAVENLFPLVAPGGTLALALYNHQGLATKVWTAVKKAYVSSPAMFKPLIAALVCAHFEGWHMVDRLLHLKNPLPCEDWRQYRSQRGMSRWYDYVDWAGGYPFETVTPDQVFDCVHPRGYELIYLRTQGAGLGCNEFTFRQKQPGEPGYKPCAE